MREARTREDVNAQRGECFSSVWSGSSRTSFLPLDFPSSLARIVSTREVRQTLRAVAEKMLFRHRQAIRPTAVRERSNLTNFNDWPSQLRTERTQQEFTLNWRALVRSWTMMPSSHALHLPRPRLFPWPAACSFSASVCLLLIEQLPRI